jgi:hypothetical protein
VDELRPVRAPWLGHLACRLVSDDSLEELLSFAGSIGLPQHWCREHSLTPHFDLSPAWRARALRAGAKAVTARDLARITIEAKHSGRLQVATHPFLR